MSEFRRRIRIAPDETSLMRMAAEELAGVAAEFGVVGE